MTQEVYHHDENGRAYTPKATESITSGLDVSQSADRHCYSISANLPERDPFVVNVPRQSKVSSPSSRLNVKLL